MQFVAAACAVIAASSAFADRFRVTVTNSTGVVVNDIHLSIQGSGGSVANPTGVTPAINNVVAVAPGGNGLDAAFPNVANGGIWAADFDLMNPLIPIAGGGTWRFNGNVVGNIAAGDVVYTRIPAPGAAALLGVFGGAAAFRRRRAA